MTKQLVKDAFGWGFLLWFVGYILGIVLFALVSPAMIGWVIMPIGMLITSLVLLKKFSSSSLMYYFKVAVAWTLIAIIFDYLFLVQLFKPEDGYYKLDVYIYYLSTFLLPVLIGWYKNTGKGGSVRQTRA